MTHAHVAQGRNINTVMAVSNRTHVAVGIIQNTNGQVFISRRHAHLHQGNKWEFPGGKVEAGEDVYQALCRELKEECNIDIQAAAPFTVISYDYPDKQVLLDVWLVTAFTGQPQQREGQEWCWVERHELAAYPFPSANEPIIERLWAQR